MRSPRYWMLPIMFEMRTERLLGIQWNPPESLAFYLYLDKGQKLAYYFLESYRLLRFM